MIRVLAVHLLYISLKQFKQKRQLSLNKKPSIQMYFINLLLISDLMLS